jgi:hypothetical protein
MPDGIGKGRDMTTLSCSKRLGKRSRYALRLLSGAVKSFGRPKVFCIGCNKTGTTSMQKALTDLGMVVGEQWLAERLIHDWGRRDYRRLFWYCLTAQAFQDVPFSWPFTFQALDIRFPGSKFILTVRDTPEEWYASMMRFYQSRFGIGPRPSLEELKKVAYIHPGYFLEAVRLLYQTQEDDLLKPQALMARYMSHNNTVIEYFRHRPGDLLVLNVAESDAFHKLCDFLGYPRTDWSFPWENKTAAD